MDDIAQLAIRMILESGMDDIDELSQLDNIRNAVKKVLGRSIGGKITKAFLPKLIGELVDRGYGTEETVNKALLSFGLKEDDETVDATSPTTGGSEVSMGGAGPSGGTKYPPGTAPTMPESLKFNGNNIMNNNVDKDVAAMLSSWKKLDKLTESCAPVLMARPKLVDEAKPEKSKESEKKVEKKDSKKSAKKNIKEGVDPAEVSQLANELAQGTITYDEFRDKLDSMEHTDYSMRQGEMGHPDRRNQEDDSRYDRENADVYDFDYDDVEDEDDDGEMFESADEDEFPWSKSAKKDNDRGTTTKTATGLKHERNYDAKKTKDVEDDDEDGDEDLAEGADQEIMEWMDRFSKLGNMKGYGR